MAATKTPPTRSRPTDKVFGLDATALSSIQLDASSFTNSGNTNLAVTRLVACAAVRKLAERIGSQGVPERLTAAGFGFLGIRKSGDGRANLFESLVKLMSTASGDTDLLWLTQTFPRIGSLLNPTHADKARRVPLPMAPLFLVFKYPDTDPINALVPGKHFYAHAMCFVDFEGTNPDLGVMAQFARARVMTAMALDPSKPDFSALHPRIRVAKLHFDFQDPSTAVNSISPGWFFEQTDATKPTTSLWNLTPVDSTITRAAIQLPAFAATELDIDTWKTRLLGYDHSTLARAFYTDQVFSKDQIPGITADTGNRLIAEAERTAPALLEAASQETWNNTAGAAIPVDAAALKKGDAASYRLMAFLARFALGGTPPPNVKDQVSDGNIVIRA